MRPNFHVNISEHFTFRECTRPSFEGSVNMDVQEDVDEDDYLRKEVSCSKTLSCGRVRFFQKIKRTCAHHIKHGILQCAHSIPQVY